MTVVRMRPAQLRRHAISCRRIAIDGAAVARQVKALPIPDGTPPEAVSEIHHAMNQLQRSAIATERQAIFLLTCAHRGALADGPLGIFANIGIPPLLSPWPMPGVPKKQRKLAAPFAFAKGALDEIASTGKSLIDLGTVAWAHQLDRMFPGLSNRIPYVGEKRRQFDEGLKWALTHRNEFLEMIGKDTVAYKQWSEGKYAEALGHNAVGLAALVVSVGKLGRIAAVAQRAKSGTGKAAKAERDAITAVKPGTSVAGRSAARRPKPWEQAMRDRKLEDAVQRIETARQRLAHAQNDLRVAQASHNAAVIAAAKEAVDVANEGLIKVSTQTPPEERR